MRLPDLTDAVDGHEAASRLVSAGFAVVPVDQATKHAGSVLHNDWDKKSARTLDDVDRLFPDGSDHAVAIHHGGSTPHTVAIDLDDVSLAPSDLLDALADCRAFVSTRSDDADRGHYLFVVPPGRHLGNSRGRLVGMGLDVRAGGAVTVAWGKHAKASAGGRYLVPGGEVVELPDWIACRLNERVVVGQADDDEVAAFRAALVPGRCDEVTRRTREGVAELDDARRAHAAGGAGRHEPGLRIVGGLVRLGKRRFPGVDEALDAVMESFFADRAGSFAARIDWSSNLSGAVGAVLADPSLEADHYVDIDAMVAGMTERQSQREAVPAAPLAPAGEMAGHARRLLLTPASEIKPRRARWLWTKRIPLGALTLTAGREGVGKSTAMYDIAARVTRGTLEGESYGTPRAVIICATEDSWAHTIVPRLMAARADLSRIYRVEVTTTDSAVELTLPTDHAHLETAIVKTGAALVLLDPLMSRVDSKINTHNDQETRQALEPLVAVVDRTGCAVVGIIHLNKSNTTDILNAVMGSRAFSAVARSVLAVQADPDDERTALLGLAKANLTSKLDVPQLSFRIETVVVAETDEGKIESGRMIWTGERAASVADTYAAAGEDPEARTLVADAAEWLVTFLTAQGGSADTADVRAAHERDRTDFKFDAVKRARARARVVSTRTSESPSRTRWSVQSEHIPTPLPPTAPTALTALTALTGTPGETSRDLTTPSTRSSQRSQCSRSECPPGAPTGDRLVNLLPDLAERAAS